MFKFGRSILFLALAVGILLTCAQLVSADSDKFPVGSYESGPFTMTFKDSGNDSGDFEVVHSSGAGVKGTYKVSGDTIEMTDISGDLACPDAVGRYHWKVEADKLLMDLVTDPCEGRAQALSLPLTKKK